MKRMDPRTLSPDAQEDLRRRVVFSIRNDKLTPSAAARLHGVSRQSAAKWNAAVADAGVSALVSKRRGPKPGSRFDPDDERRLKRMIRDDCPDQLRLPFALWSREAVVELIAKWTGRRVSLSTAGRCLRRWGFTPQKPMRRAYERDEPAVRAWLKTRYPALKARAERENARIYWGDEMGLRSDDQIGRSYAPRGKTPVVSATGKRFGCNMISAISNLGQLRFMVFKGRFVAGVFINFLARLIKSVDGQKVLLVLDSHPVHKARAVTTWLEADAARRTKLELIFLPGYAPDLNPDECVNQDTKQALRKTRPRHQEQLMSEVRRHLRRRQKQPEVVRRFFQERHVKYAA
jgi:transposase